MLKRLCCLLLAILCFIPGVSFANDAPSILDKNENLSISISLNNKEAQIGGTLDFAVTLTNNTSQPVSDWYLFSIFSDTAVSKEVADSLKCFNNEAIEPYGTVVWNITEQVSSDIYWYENNGAYYTDFEFLLDYFAYNESESYDTEYYYKSKKTPIKLTNLYDGSEFLKFSSVEDEATVYLGYEYYDSDSESSTNNVYGRINSDVSITSITGFEISNLAIKKNFDEIVEAASLAPHESIINEFNYSYWMDESEVPSALPFGVTTIFNINDKYYAAGYTKNIPAKVIDMPKLELTLKQSEDSASKYVLSVKNVSGTDYADFYFDGKTSDEFSKLHFIDIFENNQTYEFCSFDIDFLRTNFGYVLDNKLFVWNVSYYKDINDNKPETIDIVNFLQPIAYIDGKLMQDVPSTIQISDSSPSSIPAPSPTPKPTDTFVPSPSPTAAPTPTITAAPSPSPSATASLTPAVTVNSVTKKPAVPFWVWIALGGALFATGLVSVLLYIMRTKED